MYASYHSCALPCMKPIVRKDIFASVIVYFDIVLNLKYIYGLRIQVYACVRCCVRQITARNADHNTSYVTCTEETMIGQPYHMQVV